MHDRQRERPDPHHARLRDMNERARRRIDEFNGSASIRYLMMCECLLVDCSEMVEIALDAYEYVRSNHAWFLIRPGHVASIGEPPVERFEQYWIIELEQPQADGMREQ